MRTEGFICYCSNLTEERCLKKMVFGYKSQVHQFVETDMLSKIGFLYNYNKDELIGPFKAITPFQNEIDRTVFDDRYLFQVRVSPFGITERKSHAAKFFSEFGINVFESQRNHHLPSPAITKIQVEKLLNLLQMPQQPDSDVNIDSIINDLEQSVANSSLIHSIEELRNLLRFPEISEEEADRCLKFLRDNIIKKDIPDFQDSLGILRKSFKHQLILKRISNQANFNSLCSTLSLKYDERQKKYLPMIFKIINMIHIQGNHNNHVKENKNSHVKENQDLRLKENHNRNDDFDF